MKKSIICIGLILIARLGLAQSPLAIKVENLTIAQNRVLQNELQNFKISYTCIPAGIIVIQQVSNLDEVKIKVNKALKKAEIIVEHKFIENYSAELAEKECSTFRKIN
jgi:hypothetical protein